MKKPMLAEDWIESKQRFPVIVQPKVDGVRCLVGDKLYARSLKPISNLHAHKLFDNPDYYGFDGELYVGRDPTAEGLCRLTSSATGSIKGEPILTLMVFVS